MDGITILNEIIIDNADGAIVSAIFNGVIIVLALWISISMFKLVKDDNSPIIVFCFIMALLMLFTGIAVLPISISRLSDLPIVQYEVTISDDVSFTEFTEKYNIIEQRGEIYVVQEKETQED